MRFRLKSRFCLGRRAQFSPDWRRGCLNQNLRKLKFFKSLLFLRILKKELMLRLALILGIMFLSFHSFRLLAQGGNSPYGLMLKTLYKNSVPFIHSEELAAKIAEGTSLVLLDTRSEKEFRVSHLRGARLVSYDHFSAASVADLPKETEMVVYCSVGYRSERIGEKLQELGFTNVRNLYGGIFEWANQGRPVYDGPKITGKVHAYSRTWGVWLKNAEKVYD
jgi:rhodanese-related sulfurtransferase